MNQGALEELLSPARAFQLVRVMRLSSSFTLERFMVNKKEKTINYRRATWLEHQNTNTLEYFIRLMEDKLPTVADKAITFDGNKSVTCAKIKLSKEGGVLLHIVADTPGEAASIVPRVGVLAKELDVGTTNPPDDAEFMDGDAFLLVRGNDVCICATSMRDGGIRWYLSETFRKANLSNSSTQFDLLKVADTSKVSVILAQGVKEIDLRSTMFEASARYASRKNKVDSALGAASKQLRAIFGSAHDVTDDNLSIGLTIGVDRRRRGNLSLGTERINKIAIDLVNDEDYDNYVIITNNGQRISRDELTVRTKVGMKAKGKSVDRDSAWGELMKFYMELKTNGATEQ